MPVVDASSSPTSTSTVPGIPTSFTAPLLFGPLFNWALYGVLLVQIYVYSYNFPDDRRYLKFLVYLVFFLDTAQTVLTGLDAYHWFVDGLNNLEFLTRPWFSHVDIPILSGFVALIVQMFLCSRIWILNKRLWWLCIVISFFSLAQAAGAFWAGFKNLSLKSGGVIKPSIYLWFGSSVLTDVLIAVAMVFLLIQRRDNKNQFSSYVLPRVVRLIVETNVLTTTVAIITFILFVAFPNKYYFLVPDTVIGKLYSNTLLVTLNNRIYFRDHPYPGVSCDSVYLGPNHASKNRLTVVKPLGVHVRALKTNDTFCLDTFSPTMNLEEGRVL